MLPNSVVGAAAGRDLDDGRAGRGGDVDDRRVLVDGDRLARRDGRSDRRGGRLGRLLEGTGRAERDDRAAGREGRGEQRRADDRARARCRGVAARGSRSWPVPASRARTSAPAWAGGSGSATWRARPNRAGTRARGCSGRTRRGPAAARGAASGPPGRSTRRGWGSADRSWGGRDLRKRSGPPTAGWLPLAWGAVVV